jgi:peptide/nickel transport system substrate-binding protein
MKKITLILLCLVLCIFAFAGCSSNDSGDTDGLQNNEGTPDSSNNEEKSLVFGSVGYFYNEQWDPAVGWEGWAIGSYGVSECLFKLNDEFVAEPLLVDEYTSDDYITWNLNIKDNIYYHNGVKVTAETIKKCFERTMGVNERSLEVLPVKSILADGQTLTIVLSEAKATFANDLCDPIWTVYDSEGSDDFAAKTYFTGPYIPERFDPGVELTVVKNENYWGESPKLDKAVFITITDVDTLTMAFQNGEIDILVPVPETSIPILKSNPGTVIDSTTSMRSQLIRFNFNSPLVQDAAVRNAISYCIDREGYSKVICNEMTVPSYGIFPENLAYGGIKNIKPVVTGFNVEAAKKLLDAAGYKDADGDGILEKDGIKLSMKMIGLSAQKDMAELSQILKDQLKEIGIDLTVEILENISDARKNGEFDLTYESYTLGATGNPEAFISSMFKSGGTNNFGKYANGEVDGLIEKLNKTIDKDERNKTIFDISQHIVDDCSFIFFAHKNFTGAYNSETVKSYHSQPSEYYILDTAVEAK